MFERGEIIELYIEAYKQGFVYGSDAEDCNSMCEGCPAAPACKQLSEGQNYEIFTRNFRTIEVELELTLRRLDDETYR